MMIMPLVFGGMMFFFPAGLVLYWCVNNTLSILQQWSITRHPAQDRSRRKPLIAEHGNENRPPGAGFLGCVTLEPPLPPRRAADFG